MLHRIAVARKSAPTSLLNKPRAIREERAPKGIALQRAWVSGAVETADELVDEPRADRQRQEGR